MQLRGMSLLMPMQMITHLRVLIHLQMYVHWVIVLLQPVQPWPAHRPDTPLTAGKPPNGQPRAVPLPGQCGDAAGAVQPPGRARPGLHQGGTL